MGRTTNFDFPPGKETTWLSEVPANLKITTEVGGTIEIKISPHQEIKFTTPESGWGLSIIQLLIEENQLPRRPRLVKA